MVNCTICPFSCDVDRETRFGVCKLPDKFLISHYQPHFWEEPVISGRNGSGTVFFTGCNGRCVFCQNHAISQPGEWQTEDSSKEIDGERLFAILTSLIGDHRVHNVNLVSPTPYTHLLHKFLTEYRERIPVPVIWNSNGYEKKETIEALTGLVDVYLPDIKYFYDHSATKYSRMPGYFGYASEAVREMFAQVGFPEIGPDGTIRQGLVIRHLVLPGMVEESKKILDWIRETFGSEAYVSLMSQYYPTFRSRDYPEIDRLLTREEYQEITEYFIRLEFCEGLTQELVSADAKFTPRFAP